MNGPAQRTKVLVMAVATALLAALACAAVLIGRDRAEPAPGEGTDPVAAASPGPAVGPPGARLRVLSNGLLSTVALADPTGARAVTERRCDRAYTAGGTTACLTPAGALSAPRLLVLDEAGRERSRLDLTGLPNRTRVSADGRMVGWTLFVGGDSYAGGGFSTRTGILDTRTGRAVRSLEEFTVIRDGRPRRAVDTNVWGVTFSARDSSRFYATVASGGVRSLAEGDLRARTLRVLDDGVECPSLSPDGTRIAFKQAVDGDPAKGWRLTVLDLDTLRRTATTESGSVDDQAAWLDDRTLAYSLQRGDGTNDVWTVPADGTGTPRLLAPGANSPAVLPAGRGTSGD
ncbi:hypothetical protein [Streptomyces sp. NPDC097619]|uniref:hypothetical protein n=1 Tax=Streptomyces sp. NPDC097619 TaxID=3157228 RepID=UPI0033195D36